VTTLRLLLPALRFGAGETAFDDALRLAERGVGGFCVFGAPADLAARLARLQAAARHPLLIASDVEQGAGQQVAGRAVLPPAAALDAAAAEAAGMLTALEARRAGITMAFAPVCDVARHPRNPIVQARAFRDPAACAPAWIAGARRFGLRCCAKHWPGHGATDADSHDALPLVADDEDTWRSLDRPPFAAAVASGVDAVMTAHLAWPALTGDPDLPATLSRRVVHDLLRVGLGFAGLIVTDALLMDGVRAGRGEVEAARLALEAGCDALLVPEDVEGVCALLERTNADASLERLARAAAPLSDPLAASVEAHLEIGGAPALPLGPGPHPLAICDLHGGGEAIAAAWGGPWELLAPDGTTRARGGSGPGLAGPVLLVARRDRAWGGPLAVPEPIRGRANRARLVVVLAPDAVRNDLAPAAWIRAPGEDPVTVGAVRTRLLGGGVRA